MNISHLIQNATGGVRAGDTKVSDYRSGQVVRATVLHMSDDGEATVLIQGTKLRAKVEASSVTVHRPILMEVLPPGNGGELILRPIAAGSSSMAAESTAALLRAFGLADTAVHRMMIDMMQQQGVPLTRELVARMEQAAALKPEQAGLREWMTSALTAVNKQLPITVSSLQAIRQILFGPPLHDSLSRLSQEVSAWLKSSSTSGNRLASPDLITRMHAIERALSLVMNQSAALTASGQHRSGPVGQLLFGSETITRANDVRGPAKSGMAMTNVGSWLRSDGPGMMLSAAMSRLEGTAISSGQAEAGRIPTNVPASGNQTAPVASVTAPQHFVPSTARMQTMTNLPGVSPPPAASLQAPGSGLRQPDAIPNATAVRLTASNQAWSTHSVEQHALNRSGQSEHNGQPPTQVSASGTGVAAGTSSASSNPPVLLQLLRALGIDYEHTILARLAGQQGLNATQTSVPQSTAAPSVPAGVESLKALLLPLLAMDDIPVALRESAQSLVQQITGQQLIMTADRSNAMSHLTLLIPIFDERGEQTAAVTIQSRRSGKGQLDADHCRLLFDLHLTHIGNMMIDVSVDDKWVRLKIWNDDPMISEWVDAGRAVLETGLAASGYRLLSIQTDRYPSSPDSSSQSSKAKSTNTEDRTALAERMNDSYKGVDVRI